MLPNGFVSDVQQVALVVRNLDATLEEYTNRLGIGPWRVMLCEPPRLTDMRIRGEPIGYSMRLAVAQTGRTMWEIIEPVDGPSIYQEFLDEHGEGIHHLVVEHEGLDYDEALARFGASGCPPLMEGVPGRDPLRLRRVGGTPEDHFRVGPPPAGSRAPGAGLLVSRSTGIAVCGSSSAATGPDA